MTEVGIYEMWTGEKHDSRNVTSIVTKLGAPRHDLQRLVNEIKDVVYAYTGAISVTEAIGALELAKMEIHQEQL